MEYALQLLSSLWTNGESADKESRNEREGKGVRQRPDARRHAADTHTHTSEREREGGRGYFVDVGGQGGGEGIDAVRRAVWDVRDAHAHVPVLGEQALPFPRLSGAPLTQQPYRECVRCDSSYFTIVNMSERDRDNFGLWCLYTGISATSAGCIWGV